MASYGGIGLINNNLVFGYDIGEHRMYPGEPTTNLITPSINSYPTIGNSWGTFNTNQYNGAQYFSIGTISSVTSNIVTTSTSHPLRSYDVVTPQTSGGGLTAGVNYLIKKLSDTSFTIHSYNSSQDGSQGYVNPSTGNYKVYDDFANDVRVSVNSSSFPTMWWGPPHLPNSGLVKEVISNGYYNPITGELNDCIRQHIHRTDGVSDHMAYGVDASFTENIDLTCSFWGRAVDPNAVGKSINFYHYTYNVTTATAYSMNAVLGQMGEWRRYSYTFNSPNNRAISYWFNPGGPYKYDIANIQIEQKSHVTPFTTTSRTVTTSLRDIKNISTIDTTNTSYDSNAKIYFNGTNNKIGPITISINPNTNGFTFESVFTVSSNNTTWSTYRHLVGFDGSTTFYGILVEADTRGIRLDVPDSSNNRVGWSTNYLLTTGKNYHLIWTWKNGLFTLYINGVLVGTNDAGSYTAKSITATTFGYWNNGYWYGYQYVNRIYDISLSTTEILQNYNAFRIRFNI